LTNEKIKTDFGGANLSILLYITVKEFIFLCCDNLCYNPSGEQLWA